MTHWHAKVWIQIQYISVILPLFLFVRRIMFACLMVCRWQTGSDEDLGTSRRPGAEDQRWSSIDRVLGGRTIGKLGDAVCGLHRAHGDVEHGFFDSASKLRSTDFSIWFLKSAALVWWFGSQNYRDGFLVWVSKSSYRLHHKINRGRSAWYTCRDLAACFAWK
jgi:hypothetical protein